jgi:hypothetical protein
MDENTGFVNIRQFNTGREQDMNKRNIHDLRNGPAPFKPHAFTSKSRRNPRMGMLI